jgi:hypothetical protein
MTGKQTAVLWLGLLLIITRMLTTSQWSEIWGSLSTRTKAPATSTASTTPSTTGGTPPAVEVL